MPWQETSLMDQRVQFIADAQREADDVAELARRYGISRTTAYKWMAQYASDGVAGLVNRSRRPTHAPRAIDRVDPRRVDRRAAASPDLGRRRSC
jgi:transposase-like protein